jgi:hypothetical protein
VTPARGAEVAVVIKVLYRPLSLAVSVAGGVLAGKIFKAVWKRVAHEEEPPRATQQDRSWKEVVPAAALQGAVFGAVKAATDRGGLKGFEKATGVWAGE